MSTAQSVYGPAEVKNRRLKVVKTRPDHTDWSKELQFYDELLCLHHFPETILMFRKLPGAERGLVFIVLVVVVAAVAVVVVSTPWAIRF